MSGPDESEAGYKLCLAQSLCDMVINRFESHAEQLQRCFGGARDTDMHSIMAIQDLIEQAKAIIEPVVEVSERPEAGPK